MFRHLELIRRKKKEELAQMSGAPVVPEAQVTEPIEEEQIDQGRRSLLFGMGATAAVAAMPTVFGATEAVAGALDPIRQREKRIDDLTAQMQRELQSPQVIAALNGTGPSYYPLISALRRFEATDTFGTKYDMTDEIMKHCVQFAFGKNKEGKWVSGLIPASAGPSRYMPETVGYGNAFYWGRGDILVTAQHLINMSHGEPDSKAKYDIACLKLDGKNMARPEQVIFADPSITDRDVHGQPVFVVGIDKDATALKQGPVGCKIYGGGAVQLTRAWVDKAFGNADQWFKERLYRSFMVELPPDEAVGPAGDMPSSGTSGSPVFMMKNGRKEFAGIFHSVYKTPDKSIGFFYGPEVVREQYEHFIRSVS